MTTRIPSGERLNPTSTEGIQLGGFDERRPPRPPPFNKGSTKYPLDELHIGQVLYVERSRSAVREALRRFLANHKAMKFEVWQGTGKRIVVKRIK